MIIKNNTTYQLFDSSNPEYTFNAFVIEADKGSVKVLLIDNLKDQLDNLLQVSNDRLSTSIKHPLSSLEQALLKAHTKVYKIVDCTLYDELSNELLITAIYSPVSPSLKDIVSLNKKDFKPSFQTKKSFTENQLAHNFNKKVF